jgi:hypothetical protein
VYLTDTNYLDYGFEMKMVKHFWGTLPRPKLKKISDPTTLNSISFKGKTEMKHVSTHVINVKKTGIVNSIYLESTTWLDKLIHISETLALNGPVSFPLDEELPVKRGDKVQLTVAYEFGNGFRNFKAAVKKIK